MTRQEHLEWCKHRARAYLDLGDVNQAFASMVSDLGKHQETAGHLAIELGATLFFGGHLATVPKMREFIEGFN